MKKVAILMSTYNGEKYLTEQIKSIQNQTYSSWSLYIRDDGSNDNTKKIIKSYSIGDSRIKFIDDNKRLGPAGSFLYLMTIVDADYYFFCDQDDYWLKDKIKSMVEQLDQLNNTIPQVLYCNLKCVDKNLTPQKYGFDNLIGKISGINRFFGNDMPGCVMSFNRATRDLAKKYQSYDDKRIAMHDWWIALIAQTFGQVHFLNRRLIYYRQHGDNVLGAGKKGSAFRKLFQKDLIIKQEKLVHDSFQQNMALRKSFYLILPFEIKEMLNDMSKCKDSGLEYRAKFIVKYQFHLISPLRTLAYETTFMFLFKQSISS